MLSQLTAVRMIVLFFAFTVVSRIRLTRLYSTRKWSLKRDSLRQSSFVYLGVAAWHRGILVLVTVIYDACLCSISHVCIYKALLIVFRYLDDELILGIDGSSLEKLTGAMIPTVSYSFILYVQYYDALTRSRLHRSPCTLFWTLLYPTDGVCLSRVRGLVVAPAGVATIAPTQAWVLGIDNANTSLSFLTYVLYC